MGANLSRAFRFIASRPLHGDGCGLFPYELRKCRRGESVR
jgi:hypothetical protein